MKKKHTSVLVFMFPRARFINGCCSEVLWLSNRTIFLALKQNDSKLAMDAFNTI